MLVEQATQVLSRLRAAEASKNGVELAQELHELRKELGQRLDILRELGGRARLFHQKKIATNPVRDSEIVIRGASELASRFRDAPSALTLKKGKRWTGMLAALDSLMKSARSQQAEDWKRFHSTELFAGSPPEQVRARVALTPHNAEALDRYTELYKLFVAYRGSVPETAETIESARKISDALTKIKFEENVPKDVAQFLEATASTLGANLELLKPSVIDWLRSNNLLSTYVVRSRVS